MDEALGEALGEAAGVARGEGQRAAIAAGVASSATALDVEPSALRPTSTTTKIDNGIPNRCMTELLHS